MKKVVSLVLALALVAIAAAGCGQPASSQPAPSQPQADPGSAPASPDAGGAALVLRMGDNQPENNVAGITDDVFAQLVAEKTDGRITIEVYHNAQLGEETEMIQQIQYGALDFAQCSLSPLAEFADELNVLQLPYLYRDRDHFWKVMDSEIGDYFLASTEANGIIGLAWVDGGARSFYTTKKPVSCAADLAGLKIRVQESSLMMGMIEALGAVPQAMPYADVYSALQTGVIDGAENSFNSYIDVSHYEVAKYFIVDEHTRVPDVIIASTATRDKVSPEDWEIILECAKLAQEDHKDRWAQVDKEAEQKAKDAGCTVTYPESTDDFREAMSALYDDPELGQPYAEWVEKIRAVA